MKGHVPAAALQTRDVVFSVIGAVCLVLKGAYNGPLQQVVHSYGGNFVVSFALYFACLSATSEWRRPQAAAALLTLAAVTAFELTDGFGIMANVYDPIDLVANAAGVGFAISVDMLSRRLLASQRAG